MIRIDEIARHYEHAKAEHPYFADSIGELRGKKAVEVVEGTLRSQLEMRSRAVKRGNVDALEDVMQCELWKLRLALTKGEKEAAKDKCYSSMAVLLRIVDVLEGRQKLGREGE